MPSFTFSEPWCSCSKPMSFRCTDEIKDNYFDNLSFEAARFAHEKAMQFLSKSEQVPVSVTKCSNALTINVKNVRCFVKFSLHNQNDVDMTTNPVSCKSSYTSNFFDEIDNLTPQQCLLLENFDWTGFISTLGKPDTMLDIIVYSTTGIFLRAILTFETDTEKLKHAQINCSGRVFLSGQPNSIHECPWTSSSSGIYLVDTSFGVWEIEK